MIGMQPGSLAVPVGIAATLAALLSPSAASAQESTGASGAPTVALLGLPEDALLSATTSAELIDALRNHLIIDLVLPSGRTAAVSLKGKVGLGDGRGNAYFFQLRGFRWEGPAPLERFPVATALEESLGEGMDEDGWDEFDASDEESDSAWEDLVEALNVGLPNADERFWQLEGKPVGLRVRAVHLTSYRYDEAGGGQAEEFYSCCEDFDHPILQLTAAVALSNSESAEEEDGAIVYEQNILVVEFEPGPAPTGDAADAVADAWSLHQSQSTVATCFSVDFAAVPESRSRVAADTDEWTGRAVILERGGRLFVVLGDGDPADAHCTLLVSPGGVSEIGRYPVGRMTPELLEGPEAGERSFIAAFNTSDRTLVVDEGFIEVAATEPAIEASFELRGWLQSPDGREDDVVFVGSFSAAPPPETGTE